MKEGGAQRPPLSFMETTPIIYFNHTPTPIKYFNNTPTPNPKVI